jgi:hypothetical protein
MARINMREYTSAATFLQSRSGAPEWVQMVADDRRILMVLILIRATIMNTV